MSSLFGRKPLDKAAVHDKTTTTFDEMQYLVMDCLDELFCKDYPLFVNDVSERAITHKLAEYIQKRFPDLNVDCEYNRNTALGPRHAKELRVEREEIVNHLVYNKDEEDLLAISTYPDIIVHLRETNDKNLLVIEVKKKNSRVTRDHDYKKLKAFTEINGDNPYHYQYGAFILLETENEELQKPEITWFAEGKEIK